MTLEEREKQQDRIDRYDHIDAEIDLLERFIGYEGDLDLYSCSEETRLGDIFIDDMDMQRELNVLLDKKLQQLYYERDNV